MKPIVFLLALSLVAGAAQAQTSREKTSDRDVIAVVLGKKIATKDKDRLVGQIFGALLDRFATDNGIAATDDEVDAFIAKTAEKERQHQVKLEKDRKKLVAALRATNLGEADRKNGESRLKTIDGILKAIRETQARTKGMTEQIRPMQRQMARRFVKSWKVNRALYAKYGGRVIFQQAGVEPLDAYRDFLREQEKIGAFRILDKTYEASFWRYFVTDSMHTFYAGSEGAKFINTPWWMMDGPPEE